jgi:5'-nucleotidase
MACRRQCPQPTHLLARACPAACSASIPSGSVTQGQVTAVAPFGNWFVTKKVNASTLIAALNNGLSGWTGDVNGPGRFAQVGFLRYSFDPSLPADSRLVNAQLLVNGTAQPLADFKGEVLLLTTDYLAKGGDL